MLQSLGYTYVPPEDLEPERPSLKESILTRRLAATLLRLNPWLSETNLARAVKAVTRVPAASLAEANETLYTSLTYGIALEQDRGDGRKSHTVRFLDLDKPKRNEWLVTRQYRVLGAKKHVIPDIVVLVNGLPLVVVECKSPTIGDTWKAEAVKQLHRYQEAGSRWKDQGAPKLFEAAQILVATCGERAVYGTVGTPERFFLEWKEPSPLTVERLGEKLGRGPTPQDILLHGLLEPRNLLDIVRSFVVFEVKGGRTVRKFARYKQLIAVNEAMRRIRTARKPSARGGILREEMKDEQIRARDVGLDARSFAIYGLLERQRPMPVREDAASYDVANRDLASLIDEEVTPFTELVDWWQKDDLQRRMRSRIKRQLRAGGVEADAVESLAADIVDLAKVRTDR